MQEAAIWMAARMVRLARTFSGPGMASRGDQIVRAALSIPSNIAEACGRTTVHEFRQFIGYAKGSAQELRSRLRVARLVDPRREGELRALENRAVLIVKMLERLQQHPPPQR